MKEGDKLPGPSWLWWAFGLSVALLIGLTMLIAIINPTKPPYEVRRTEASRTSFTAIPCLCATSYDDIYGMLRAYKDSDLAAMAGLLSRGKAIQPPERTKLLSLGRTTVSRPCWSNLAFIRANAAISGVSLLSNRKEGSG